MLLFLQATWKFFQEKSHQKHGQSCRPKKKHPETVPDESKRVVFNRCLSCSLSFFRNRGWWSGNSFEPKKNIVNCPFFSSCDILIIKSATFWNSNQLYSYNYWFLNCFPQWWKFQNDAIVKDAEAVLEGFPVLGPVSKPFNFRLHTLENTLQQVPFKKKTRHLQKTPKIYQNIHTQKTIWPCLVVQLFTEASKMCFFSFWVV